MESEEIKVEIEEFDEEKEFPNKIFQTFPEKLNRGKIWTDFVALSAYFPDKEVI